MYWIIDEDTGPCVGGWVKEAPNRRSDWAYYETAFNELLPYETSKDALDAIRWDMGKTAVGEPRVVTQEELEYEIMLRMVG